MMPRTNPSGFVHEERSPNSFVLELPSDIELIERTVAFLVERARLHGYAGSRLELNFRVGLTEALANAVRYGNQEDPEVNVRVEAEFSATRLSVWVIDRGPGFDPSQVPNPTVPPHLHRPGGRGIFLIRSLMDEVEFNGRGNAVRLVLYREHRFPYAAGQ